MTEVRLSPEAESELDEIWLYLARASGNIEIANRVIDHIAERLWLLWHHPQLGRRRDHDLRPGLRSLTVEEYVILYRIEPEGNILIQHVMHGARDISGFLGL